jgi:DNA-binding NtrC family response regulator
MNIMIVDDEIDQLESLRRGLKSKGHGVIEALNTDEALFIMDEKINDIDILLVDYLMPGKNGIDLLNEVRTRYGAIPVIIMSAYRTRELSVNIKRKGYESFIEKPFTLVQLVNEIEKLTSKKSNE